MCGIIGYIGNKTALPIALKDSSALNTEDTIRREFWY